jgi:hypothetical protein
MESGKGFATMVEELVHPPKQGIPKKLHIDKLEIVYPASRQQRSKDIQQGLLSLLSDLNQSNNGVSNRQRERRISPLPPEIKSFVPLLPSQDTPSERSSQNDTLTAKYTFSTLGLPPITQRTKHGLVKITENGCIEVHLPSISRNTFSISSNSKQIAVSDNRKVVWQGAVDELPWRWTKIYRYASRFVRICRARIPRVSVEVDGIRGRVMLNGEFEGSDTREGTFVRVNCAQRTAKVYSIEDDLENLRWQGDVTDVPPDWRDLLRSSLLLYQKCLAINKDASFSDDPDNTARCVPGIGWCTTQGKRIQFFFEDGSRMIINTEYQEIIYCDPNQKKEKWELNHYRLPTYIEERLDRCMAFKDVE